jgi:hypothetical protein
MDFLKKEEGGIKYPGWLKIKLIKNQVDVFLPAKPMNR